MTVIVALTCTAFLLALAVLAVIIGRNPVGRIIIYSACLATTAVAFVAGAGALIGQATPSAATLPLGLPWVGMHFRTDALATFFLAVVNLGAATASLFALGYGRHEHAPLRVVPFYPAFLAGMNLVVLADDAFTFLVSWELMSLMSWALVVAHHRVHGNVHAGYVYLVMASFGTLMLLLAFGILAGADGGYAFAAIRGAEVSPGLGAAVLVLALAGTGSKAGLVPLHV